MSHPPLSINKMQKENKTSRRSTTIQQVSPAKSEAERTKNMSQFKNRLWPDTRPARSNKKSNANSNQTSQSNISQIKFKTINLCDESSSMIDFSKVSVNESFMNFAKYEKQVTLERDESKLHDHVKGASVSARHKTSSYDPFYKKNKVNNMELNIHLPRKNVHTSTTYKPLISSRNYKNTEQRHSTDYQFASARNRAPVTQRSSKKQLNNGLVNN